MHNSLRNPTVDYYNINDIFWEKLICCWSEDSLSTNSDASAEEIGRTVETYKIQTI